MIHMFVSYRFVEGAWCRLNLCHRTQGFSKAVTESSVRLLMPNWKACSCPWLCHVDGLWQYSYNLQFVLWNHLWWQEFSTWALWWALFFSPPSPQHLGDSQNTSSFKESLEVGCLGRNIIIFSSSVACSRMGRTSSFLCFVYCFISDELPSMTVLKLSNLFFIGIHVTITMQPFMPLKKMKLGYPNILSHLGIFIYS